MRGAVFNSEPGKTARQIICVRANCICSSDHRRLCKNSLILKLLRGLIAHPFRAYLPHVFMRKRVDVQELLFFFSRYFGRVNSLLLYQLAPESFYLFAHERILFDEYFSLALRAGIQLTLNFTSLFAVQGKKPDMKQGSLARAVVGISIAFCQAKVGVNILDGGILSENATQIHGRKVPHTT